MKYVRKTMTWHSLLLCILTVLSLKVHAAETSQEKYIRKFVSFFDKAQCQQIELFFQEDTKIALYCRGSNVLSASQEEVLTVIYIDRGPSAPAISITLETIIPYFQDEFIERSFVDSNDMFVVFERAIQEAGFIPDPSRDDVDYRYFYQKESKKSKKTQEGLQAQH